MLRDNLKQCRFIVSECPFAIARALTGSSITVGLDVHLCVAHTCTTFEMRVCTSYLYYSNQSPLGGFIVTDSASVSWTVYLHGNLA